MKQETENDNLKLNDKNSFREARTQRLQAMKIVFYIVKNRII